MIDAPHERIGARLREARQKAGFTQQALSEKLGLNHRQTLAEIEAGARRITPEELARAALVLEVDLEYFTDSFRLVGEGEFSFRARNVDPEVLGAFQDRAGRWIATYRTLTHQAGISTSRIGTNLQLSPRSSFEDAHACAEELRLAWNLGNVPAEGLESAIQHELGAQVLYVEAPSGVSGAASHLPGMNTILINLREPAGRRYFDLAHELFHLLTWDAMPPARVESPDVPPTKGNRVEWLAENFAGALLMPAHTVAERWAARNDHDVHDWLNTTATSLRVTSVALKWRMLILGHLTKAEVDRLHDERLAGNGGLTAGDPVPLLFNAEFVRRVFNAVEVGRLSLRRAAQLLDLAVDDFAALCRSYGLPLSYET